MVKGCPVPRVCLVMALCLVAVACTHWRDSYFEDGVGQVSHADVEKKFGEPHKTRESALGDESTWVYRIVISESDTNPMSAVGDAVAGLSNAVASIVGGGGGGGGAGHSSFH